MARPLAHPNLYNTIKKALAEDKSVQVKDIAASTGESPTLIGRYLRRARTDAGLRSTGRGSGVSVRIASPQKWQEFQAAIKAMD